jgi:hypothetical protein
MEYAGKAGAEYGRTKKIRINGGIGRETNYITKEGLPSKAERGIKKIKVE